MSIDQLIGTLPIDEEIKKKYASDIEYVENFLSARGITVNESVAYMFYNHFFAFLERIDRGECSQTLEEDDVRDQLTDEACDLARELSAPLFQKYGIGANKCEEVLLATYFVMLLGDEANESKIRN